ncbi:hypothetical protein AeMF1_018593 [Aphanomyces euteiches]|nr:hypothetical protein AeMF1_018593 [Aphanomyces euteiches]
MEDRCSWPYALDPIAAFMEQSFNNFSSLDMSSIQHVRALSLFDGSSSSGIYVVAISAGVVAVLLFLYGAYKAKRARELELQNRESTADTVIHLEIETPKSCAYSRSHGN